MHVARQLDNTTGMGFGFSSVVGTFVPPELLGINLEFVNSQHLFRTLNLLTSLDF